MISLDWMFSSNAENTQFSGNQKSSAAAGGCGLAFESVGAGEVLQAYVCPHGRAHGAAL
jgi:hypothetical protein